MDKSIETSLVYLNESVSFTSSVLSCSSFEISFFFGRKERNLLLFMETRLNHIRLSLLTYSTCRNMAKIRYNFGAMLSTSECCAFQRPKNSKLIETSNQNELTCKMMQYTVENCFNQQLMHRKPLLQH